MAKKKDPEPTTEEATPATPAEPSKTPWITVHQQLPSQINYGAVPEQPAPEPEQAEHAEDTQA
ncbi:MAG TPA: hypothetical protein VGJ60_07760 [Chloroflexota bacterium]